MGVLNNSNLSSQFNHSEEIDSSKKWSEINLHPLQSEVQVDFVRNKTRITKALPVSPLKLLFPGSTNKYASVIFSNYGGGMVEGDDIYIKLNCNQTTTTYFSTQAINKIFK